MFLRNKKRIIFNATILAMLVSSLGLSAFARNPADIIPPSSAEQKTALPAWAQRGLPGAAHAALEPLIGKWQVELSVYGALGRDPKLPPLVSNDITTTRNWIANGSYIEDTTEGTIGGQPYWRRGWLGYSNIDRRYEWVTIAPLVPMMFYQAKPGSGTHMPINLTGTFTDQGVVSEQSLGKTILQRTVIRIENNDRHIFELYFTPSGKKEQLAMRLIYARIK